MRLFTYIGLVARRVWAKRGVLVGSFLGATLVTGLLVIVPLYEASVQAIDLLFTVRNAPADDVEISAFYNDTDYSAAVGSINREVVTEAHRWVARWYPQIEERSQSREFVVIPVDGAVDWLGAAEQWREQIDQLVEEGADPETFPPAPYPTPPREATTARVMTSPDVESKLEIVAGSWPEPEPGLPSAGPAAPLRIAVGSELAAIIQRGPGDRFVLRPFSGFPNVFELVEIASVVDAIDPTEAFWGLDDPSRMFYLPQETFDAWTGVIATDPDADQWRRESRGFPSTDVTQRWFLPLDRTTLQLEGVDDVRGGIAQFRAELSREAGVASNTFLPQVLDQFDLRSVVIGGPILAILALVVGGALYFLIYTAALTLEREGPELALLRTRGASSWQTVGIHLSQSLVIAGLAALAAPYVARFLVAFTGRIPPLSDLTGGEPLRVAQVRSLTPFVLGGALLTFVSMGLAILPFARKGVLELRSLAARPTTSSVWQRYNLDLFAIGLSIVILFQLAQRGFINTSGEEATLDPLAIVFPALLLFTGALVLLRILPLALKLLGWAMTKVRGLPMALPGWHLGRNPVPYGRLALLVWLTTGLGAFALTYANTLETSFDDRAGFAAGADVRIVADEAGWLEVPEGDVGTPVFRSDGAPRQSSRRAEVLAVRPDGFADVVVWRSDFGGDNPHDVFLPLRPDGRAPDLGIEIPSGVEGLRVDGVVVPRSLAEQEALGAAEPDPSLRLLMKVYDATGRVWTLAGDERFEDERWQTVEVTFDQEGALNSGIEGEPVPPLSIHTIWLERDNPSGGAVINGEALLATGWEFFGPEGTSRIDFTEMTPSNGLAIQSGVAADVALRALYAELPEGREPPTQAELDASPLARDGTVDRWQLPGQRTRVNPLVPQLRRIPDDLYVLLDREAAAIAGLNVGDTTSYSVAAQVFNGELAGIVGTVPTMSNRAREGNMIIDLDAFSAWVNGPASWSWRTSLARVAAPGELWVRTDNVDNAVRRLTGQMTSEPDRVITIRGASSDFSSRPVQVGLVAILFVGAATGVVLALAGVTGYVLLAVARRAREMGVLRALGFHRRGVASTFAVEQLVVLGLGAIIGTAGGIALMWTMIPFLQLGETAEEIEPEILLTVNWTTLGIYVAAVAALLIVSVVWATRRVSVRRMSEVLREVER